MLISLRAGRDPIRGSAHLVFSARDQKTSTDYADYTDTRPAAAYGRSSDTIDRTSREPGAFRALSNPVVVSLRAPGVAGRRGPGVLRARILICEIGEICG